MDVDNVLENALKKIIEDEGLNNAKIKYEDATTMGYICNVKLINIIHDDSVLNLFVKRLPRPHSETARVAFANEINFYQNIMGELKKLDPDVSNYVPKCYYADGEVLVLENLQTSGMKVWDDLKILLDEEHVKTVMEHYGKFHAISTALKIRFPKIFYGISKNFDVYKFAYLHLEAENFRTAIGKKAAAAFNEDERKYSDALMVFVEDKLYDFHTDMFDDKEHDVIVHGDCWPHNFFFEYKESKISKMCLIDFQLSFQASPIIDLSYFFCTSACSKEHFDNIDKYLKIYHESFSKKMEELGLRPEETISFNGLRKQWRKHGKYGLNVGMILNKMLIADKEELIANHRDEILLSFDFISRNEDMYHQRMRDMIMYFYDNNML